MTETTDIALPTLLLGASGSDPIEDRLRGTVRATIEALFDEEFRRFSAHPLRSRRRRAERLSPRPPPARAGRDLRHGDRQGEDGKAPERRSKALARHQRLTRRAEAPIPAVYLAGTDTRRVKRALFGLFRARSARTSSARPGAR